MAYGLKASSCDPLTLTIQLETSVHEILLCINENIEFKGLSKFPEKQNKTKQNKNKTNK